MPMWLNLMSHLRVRRHARTRPTARRSGFRTVHGPVAEHSAFGGPRCVGFVSTLGNRPPLWASGRLEDSGPLRSGGVRRVLPLFLPPTPWLHHDRQLSSDPVSVTGSLSRPGTTAHAPRLVGVVITSAVAGLLVGALATTVGRPPVAT